MKGSFPIRGWRWIFYIIGWITGALNLGFWVIMILLYLVYDQGKPFFGSHFHRRVFMWGVVMSIILLLMALFLVAVLRVVMISTMPF